MGRGTVAKSLTILVGVTGFEPATPASRTQCSTGLSYTPTAALLQLVGYTIKPEIDQQSSQNPGNLRLRS